MPEPDARAGHTVDDVRLIEAPPTTIGGILRRLGPGLIIAASIVGSGELIMTTKAGAEAGFALLWLIIVGCVIKVFVQIEFGRFAVCRAQTSLEGMNEVPGPRIRVNWLIWYWLFMFLLGLGQLGGILGGVGQSMAMTIPFSGDYKQYLAEYESVVAKQKEHDQQAVAARERDDKSVLEQLGPRPKHRSTRDDMIWNAIIGVLTAVLLVNGRYSLIQHVSTAFVVAFVAATFFNLFQLQTYPRWAISWADIAHGLSFQLPSSQGNSGAAVATALAAFGIIGVGASELVAYPYWCLERGYARFTGPHENSAEWAHRARGWLRVMRWDAFVSLIIYTLATLAFYLLGAGVLSREGKVPSNETLVSTLAGMYEPVFGPWAGPIFLVGAFAVLYSTFFVATAGNARMAADALRIYGLIGADDDSRRRWVRNFCLAFPLISLTIVTSFKEPVTLVAMSGLAQSIMLPMLGAAALFFRYRRCDDRIRPGRLWDMLLWGSVAALLVVGLWGVARPLLKLGL